MNDDLPALAARIDRTNELLTRMLAEVAKTPSTHAIFVDAGYLYAAAGRLVAGTEDRRAFDVDAEGLIEALIDRARSIFADSRLLRVYWYDGARRRIHTSEQQSIAELPDVKVRLGNLNANNQQKGVDSLIRTDLESLARHRAISDAALLGGDEDLVSAVEAAQGTAPGCTCGASRRRKAATRPSRCSGRSTVSAPSTWTSSSRTSHGALPRPTNRPA